MKRGSFLKSLVALVAAPSLLGDLDFTPVSGRLPLLQPIDASRARFVSGYIKVTREMLNDLPAFQEVVRRRLLREAAQSEIDMSKPTTMQVGLHGDDFIQNMATITIRQDD